MTNTTKTIIPNTELRNVALAGFLHTTIYIQDIEGDKLCLMTMDGTSYHDGTCYLHYTTAWRELKLDECGKRYVTYQNRRHYLSDIYYL